MGAATPANEIKVDQAGYLLAAPKMAFVAVKNPASDLLLKQASDRAVVFKGKLPTPAADVESGRGVTIY